MQISVKKWRVAKVSLAELRAAAGVAESADGTAILTGLRQSLGPLGPRIRFFFPDVDNTVRSAALQASLSPPRDIDLVMGGPPCQGFSGYNPHRRIDDPRNSRMELVIAGIEVEAFDVRAEGLPFAGMIHADPLDSIDMAREEGALRAELERIGLRVEVEKLEWRFSYEVKE